MMGIHRMDAYYSDRTADVAAKASVMQAQIDRTDTEIDRLASPQYLTRNG